MIVYFFVRESSKWPGFFEIRMATDSAGVDQAAVVSELIETNEMAWELCEEFAKMVNPTYWHNVYPDTNQEVWGAEVCETSPDWLKTKAGIA